MKIYYPYPANDNKHKYYIITNTGKKVYFGAYGMSDYTIHKEKNRQERYINRHKNEERFWNKDGVNTASFWSRFLLWGKPSFKESYEDIVKNLKKWGYL